MKRSLRTLMPPGFSVLEMLVVVSILAIVMLIMGAGVYGMRKGQAVNAAQSVVGSTLRHARALAIANNAIYHVRFSNIDPTTAPPNQPALQQYISIYYFPNQAAAANVVDASQVAWDPAPTNFRGDWNAGTTYVARDVVSYTTNGIVINYYKAGAQSVGVNPSTAATVPVGTSPSSGTAIWSDVTTNFNVLVARYVLPQGSYFGIQYLNDGNPNHGVRRKMLQFLNDGTLHTDIDGGITLFFTDNIKLADDQSAPDYDTTLQDDRRNSFNDAGAAAGRGSSVSSHVKITQVFQLGMIREWHKRPNNPQDHL